MVIVVYNHTQLFFLVLLKSRLYFPLDSGNCLVSVRVLPSVVAEALGLTFDLTMSVFSSAPIMVQFEVLPWLCVHVSDLFVSVHVTEQQGPAKALLRLQEALQVGLWSHFLSAITQRILTRIFLDMCVYVCVPHSPLPHLHVCVYLFLHTFKEWFKSAVLDKNRFACFSAVVWF